MMGRLSNKQAHLLNGSRKLNWSTKGMPVFILLLFLHIFGQQISNATQIVADAETTLPESKTTDLTTTPALTSGKSGSAPSLLRETFQEAQETDSLIRHNSPPPLSNKVPKIIKPSQQSLLKTPPEVISLQDKPGVLTYERFLLWVDTLHPTLQVADIDRKLASARRLERQGAFDPVFNSTTYFIRYNSGTALGKAKEALESQNSVDFLTRMGPKFSIGQKITVGDITPPLSPTGDAGEYFADIRVPLLRGRGINTALANEKKGFLGEDLARAAFQRQRLALLLKASEVYWKWIATHQKLGVEQDLIKLARIRKGAVDKLAEQGDMAAIGSVEAEQELQRRIGRFQKASRDMQEATFNLSAYLWEKDGRPGKLPDEQNLPPLVLSPEPVSPSVIEESKLNALLYRPELKVLDFSRSIAQVDKALARNNILPQLDGFAYTGYETGKNNIGPTVRAGVSMSVPFLQRTARAQLQQAQLTLDRITLEEKQLLRNVFLEIVNAVSALNATYERYEAAQKEYQAALKLEEGERTSFAMGDSTLFLVNQRERATAEAKMQLIDLQADYQIQKAILQTVTGTL